MHDVDKMDKNNQKYLSMLPSKVALVTGSSSGIGQKIAEVLANDRYTVALVSRDLERLRSVIQKIREKSPNSKIYPIDLASEIQIYKLVEALKQDFERIDLLVHSAAAFSMGKIEFLAVEDLDYQYRVNLRAPYLLTQLLLSRLRVNQGQIVFINSSVGLKSKANLAQYAATKHGLKAIADSLREEVNGDGLRVLSIYPGPTATPMQELVYNMEGCIYEPQSLIQPEDIAKVVLQAVSVSSRTEVADIKIQPTQYKKSKKMDFNQD